jgi:OFA family oxalate/formate antiporter-like MFS transporter
LAKGTASLLIPIASIWIAKDNWELVITIGTTLSVCAGLAAKFLLEPMRKDFIKKDLHSMITLGALEHEHSSKAIPPLPSEIAYQPSNA